jgi:hypothetical protein
MEQPAAPTQIETGSYTIRRTRLSKLSWLLAPLAVFVSSCGSADSDKPLPQAPAAARPAASTDSDVCLARTKGFLHWYYRYYNERNFPRPDTSTWFINYPITADDSASVKELRGNISSTPYLQLNRRKLEVYLDTLRRSGYFSESYLTNLRTSILRRGQKMEASKQSEGGVVEGFEADEVLDTQDIYNLSAIDKLAVYHPAGLQPGTQAYRLELLPDEDFRWYFYLKNENGRCVIDSLIADH